MSTVLFRFERHIGQLIRKVEIETDFLPKVGDSVNAYNIFDDVKVEPGDDGWFFTVYEIRWSVEGNRLMPTVHLMSSKHADRKRLLAVDRGEMPEDTA
jgi:hypothetical protein